MIAVAAFVVLAMLATPAFLWPRLALAGHDRSVEPPEHTGADEAWSPLADLADLQAADWDEDALLRAQLDQMQQRWKARLDEIEVEALAVLARHATPVRELTGVAA